MGRKNCLYSKKMIQELKKYTNQIRFILSNNSKGKLPKKILKWKGDYIFCFRSFFILKKNFLNHARVAAINFHPGTPKYRGVGCINFSLLNKEKFYGATCHLMDERLDFGQIINSRKFKIKKNDSIKSILKKTYDLQFNQFKDIMKKLSENPLNLRKLILSSKKEKWSKKLFTRNDLNNLYKMNNKNKIYITDINTYLKSTITDEYKPYIEIGKKKFYINL